MPRNEIALVLSEQVQTPMKSAPNPDFVWIDR
jgi:hypothetical protein